MKATRSIAGLFAALALCFAALGVAAGSAEESTPPNVTTAGYSTLRDNWDPNEPALSPAAVQSGGFGQLFSVQVSGAIYSQPLVYDGTVVVTTERANAYGINAATGAIEWHRSFGTPVTAAEIDCGDLTPYLGSTSTPVIDPATGTIYMTTRLQEGGSLPQDGRWSLQALSATTGKELPGFPVKISGTPWNTPGVPFDPELQLQRPGLLLLGGVVYMAFGSDCDFPPYRGIVAGYNETTGAQTTMWSDEAGVGTGEDSQAGIWQSGGGLVSTGPNQIILTSGNGVSPQPARSADPPETLSESVIGLTVGSSGKLKAKQFFAPSNAPTLDANDEDLGSGGPIALPTEYFGTTAIPQLVVQVGKDGRVFLINANHMGGYRQGPGGTDEVLQTLGPFTGVWGHPAAYGGQGGWVYVMQSGGGGYLQALSYGLSGSGQPALSVAGQSAESFGYSSGSPLVTSNGTEAGSAVVWVLYVNGAPEEGNEGGHDAQLRAYGAMPVDGTLPLLWSATAGDGPQFAVPTAYDGRIYMGTRGGRLLVFGASSQAPVKAAPVNLGSVPVGQSATSTIEVKASSPVTITGPVTAQGDQGLAGPATATRSKTGTAVKGATAGPHVIPPSGERSLAAGVLTIGQPRRGTAIQAGTTLRVPVTFRPAHPGPVVEVAFLHTSAGLRTVTVSGYGTAPGLVTSARPLAFGNVRTRVGGKALTLTFSNSWSRPERITGYELPQGPYHVSGLPPAGTVLAPLQAVTVSVDFNPSRAGVYRALLRISTDHGSVSRPLSGAAQTGAGRLTPSSLHISFGAVPVGHSGTRVFTLSNTGNVPLTISRAIPPVGAFSTPLALPEGIVIEPGLSVRQTITFRPDATGAFIGRYHFNSNDGQGPVTVTFTGRGT